MYHARFAAALILILTFVSVNTATAQMATPLGGEPGATTSEDMRAFVEAEIAKWRKVIEARNIERQSGR